MFSDTGMDGLRVLHRRPFTDGRGSLDRLFDVDAVQAEVPGFSVSQVNHTVTRGRGTVRGMHFQYPPAGDVKLVTCLQGRVVDVVVDVRHGSATFLEHVAVELDAGESVSLLIPEGCAHGFQALADHCEMLYVHGGRYVPESEGGLSPLDARLAIEWPLEVVNLSDRDRSHLPVTDEWAGVGR